METLGDIIVAALALLGTLGGSYFANRRASALMLYRLEQVERKVDKLDNTRELAEIRERLSRLEGQQQH